MQARQPKPARQAEIWKLGHQEKPQRSRPTQERQSLIRRLFSDASQIDQPFLAPGVQLLDLQIESRALGRTVTTRTIFPIKALDLGVKLPVIYLLPDNTGNFRVWTNYSEATTIAANGTVLVIPDALSTYYIDDTRGWTGYYEQFFTNELIPAILRRIPVASAERERSALVGVARGAYGAVTLGLKHPQRFGFVGALGAPLDLPQRSFRWQSPLESLALNRAFGPRGSAIRQANDPFALVRNIDPAHSPFFWLSCGSRGTSLATCQSFVSALQERALPYSWQRAPGGHNWAVWDAQLPELETALHRFFDGAADQNHSSQHDQELTR
jgi:putative tributyrin esterase